MSRVFLSTTPVGIPFGRYMAPEVAQGLPANETADTYSFAMVLWEMIKWSSLSICTTRPAFGISESKTENSILRRKRINAMPHFRWLDDQARIESETTEAQYWVRSNGWEHG